MLSSSMLNAQTLLLSEGFEGSMSSWSSFPNIITSEEVHSGSFSSKYKASLGASKSIPPSTEVYFKQWLYFPVGFDWSVKGGKHFWRLIHDSSTYMVRQIDTQTGFVNQTVAFILFIGSNGQQQGPTYRMDIPFPEGKWFSFEYHIKLNDTLPMLSNGIVEAWIDGVPCPIYRGAPFNDVVPSLTNMNFNWDKPFNKFRLDTNYDNCPPSSDKCFWYSDDLEVWNGCPPGSPCY